MKLPSYCELISDLPKKEQAEIIKGFYKKHNDFRDSVQRPQVISTLIMLLGAGLISAIEIDQSVIRSVAVTSLIIVGYILNQIIDRLLVDRNRNKFRSYLKEIYLGKNQEQIEPEHGPYRDNAR